MKYYYDCPLKAALMTKYYGMRIYTPHGPNNGGMRKQSVTSLSNHSAENYNAGKVKYYIHPDSLPILEPQVGDLIIIRTEHNNGGIGPDYEEWCEGTPFILTDKLIWDLEKPEYWPRKDGQEKWQDFIEEIIQRNNTPFMWPKEEPCSDG